MSKVDFQSTWVRLAIFGIIIGIFAIIALITSGGAPKQVSPLSAAESKLETASVDVVKSSLRYYYATERKYPLDYDTLLEAQSEDSATYLKDAHKTLKDFNYSVTGDREKYRFTYTSLDGDSKEVEGNYKEDYR